MVKTLKNTRENIPPVQIENGTTVSNHENAEALLDSLESSKASFVTTSAIHNR